MKTILIFAALFAFCLGSVSAEIRFEVSYGGLKGELYRYEISERKAGTLKFELVYEGKVIERGTISGYNDLSSLSKEIITALVSAEFAGAGEDKEQKVMSFRLVVIGVEKRLTLKATDQELFGMIADSRPARSFFGDLSSGRPKMFRLYDPPGPLKAHKVLEPKRSN